MQNTKRPHRKFPRMALPPDVVADGWTWMNPPTPAELMRRYQQLTRRMDAERAARIAAIELLLSADRMKEQK